MTSRLDALRFDASRLGSAGRDSPAVEALRRQGIERRRLDGVEPQTGRAGRTKAADRSGIPDFQSEAPPSSSTARRQSLEETLAAFVTPQDVEPAILRRSIPILQDCLANLIPKLEGGEPLRKLAASLMEEEIGRHRSLRDRLREG
jgi:hypothetical protein